MTHGRIWDTGEEDVRAMSGKHGKRLTMREMDAHVIARRLVEMFRRNPFYAPDVTKEDAIAKALLEFADSAPQERP